MLRQNQRRPRIESVDCFQPGSSERLCDNRAHREPLVHRRQRKTDLNLDRVGTALVTSCEEASDGHGRPVEGQDLRTRRRSALEGARRHKHPAGVANDAMQCRCHASVAGSPRSRPGSWARSCGRTQPVSGATQYGSIGRANTAAPTVRRLRLVPAAASPPRRRDPSRSSPWPRLYQSGITSAVPPSPAAVVTPVGTGPGTESWASSPATRKSMQGNRSRPKKTEFQSSPGPKAERCILDTCDSVGDHAVSILARPEGRALLTPAAATGTPAVKFQSSPGPKAERCPPQPRTCGRALRVSILARPEGRALPHQPPSRP